MDYFIWNLLVESTILWWCYSEISLNNKLSTSQSINVPTKGDKEITLKFLLASHIMLGSCGILRNTGPVQL